MKERKFSRTDFLFILISIGIGLFAGYVDFRNDEPQAAVIVIGVGGIIIGFLQPKKAWLWAIIIALGLPAAYLIGAALGYTPHDWPQPGLYATLLTLIPSFIANYCGAFARQALTKPRPHSQK